MMSVRVTHVSSLMTVQPGGLNPHTCLPAYRYSSQYCTTAHPGGLHRRSKPAHGICLTSLCTVSATVPSNMSGARLAAITVNSPELHAEALQVHPIIETRKKPWMASQQGSSHVRPSRAFVQHPTVYVVR